MDAKKQRNILLDFIKGIAIIAVALYHFGGGILPFGYLGVDIFFVVGGYFLLRSLVRKLNDGSFRYWKYLSDKLVRLWPLVLLAITVSLLLGFFLMLPDDYENLAESAIASSFFSNNILQCITTKNY
ncbi:MAG: acyltransferase, partial [Clostridiaceae bacterium]|nr:acyltransferase [Clostridiaceae bacterium]